MHQRRVSPLAIVLPHPQLPTRRSISSPHTPHSRGSPACSTIFLTNPNRRSTDSWTSSNGPDDLDCEWAPDHTLLLSRTLDALPAHLVTPFNGPIPPSNLLDKIARGVSQAKPDWPHSLRATRVKLIELARTRAKDDACSIAEEDPDDGPYGGLGHGPKRPLYRQSSMDFINTVGKDTDAIARLSTRLQYHPYSRTPRTPLRRSQSPPRSSTIPSLINPSTPSSSTLNSLSTRLSSVHRDRVLRRSASPSPTQASPLVLLVAPLPLTPRPTRYKRAPSFGALAQEAREQQHVRTPSYPSSDEEEKIRAKSAKKPRQSKPEKKPKSAPTPAPPPFESPTKPTRRRMNPQRNPSMFGAELPQLPEPSPHLRPKQKQGRRLTDSPALAPLLVSSPAPSPPETPATQGKPRTLRRVRRLAPARRIEFGASEATPSVEEREAGGLGSAFVLC
ncbi:hypothetical protein BD779DRAFT_1796717 [Infundibulicybe gibba]|nr:hypothetical protein BD779DRAFT_1796717 [Infundibulicybe gibba]